MQEQLAKKLHAYIRDNNPDLLLVLEQEQRVSDYLQESLASVESLIDQLVAEAKAPSLIEEICMEELTRPLKPSRFNYLSELLETEFAENFEKLQSSGVLKTELINMISACDPVFDELKFSEENVDDRALRYAITGAVHEYLSKT